MAPFPTTRPLRGEAAGSQRFTSGSSPRFPLGGRGEWKRIGPWTASGAGVAMGGQPLWTRSQAPVGRQVVVRSGEWGQPKRTLAPGIHRSATLAGRARERGWDRGCRTRLAGECGWPGWGRRAGRSSPHLQPRPCPYWLCSHGQPLPVRVTIRPPHSTLNEPLGGPPFSLINSPLRRLDNISYQRREKRGKNGSSKNEKVNLTRNFKNSHRIKDDDYGQITVS